MTKVFLIVSVACNVWFLSLLLYDRIMEAKLIRFFRHIAGLWRSLDCTAAEQGKDKDMPHADTSDIIGKSRFKMASTRTTAAVTYATQKIIRQSNVTERSLVTTCRLLNASRSDDNPNGFTIEGFTIIENKDLQTIKR